MFLQYLLCVVWVLVFPTCALPTLHPVDSRNVSQELFNSLEELARVVDISYCVGTSGIHKPFKCLSRCGDFEGFELITTWNTGPLLSDSCGYIALSHPPHPKRVIVAFRGTYSIANTIADLSTNPAEYAPFPADGDGDAICASYEGSTQRLSTLPQFRKQNHKRNTSDPECHNCTVHGGFWESWQNTRCTIIPHVEQALQDHSDYELTLVGHSLGGAVAALAALEFQGRGLTPHVTTFGEPRLGNKELNDFIDLRFNLSGTNGEDALYRRVTHVADPVPLLPLEEWGYRMHGGEIYISKPSLRPTRYDLERCNSDEDPACIAGGVAPDRGGHDISRATLQINDIWHVPNRYQLWELFFAHRDYFWRLGLCLPGGDPWDWPRDKYDEDLINHEL